MVKCYAIIVTYNGAHWISKCLTSLINSSLKNHIIVIDNGSTDNTLELIKKDFHSVELIETGENLGFGKANNIGLKRALEDNIEYAFLLNQDAWVEPHTLANLVEEAQQNPKFGVISPLHYTGEGDLLDMGFYFYFRNRKAITHLFEKPANQTFWEIEFANAAAWLITKETLQTIGGFSPFFYHYGEDDNYIRRLQYHNLKMGLSIKCKIFHDRESRYISEEPTENAQMSSREERVDSSYRGFFNAPDMLYKISNNRLNYLIRVRLNTALKKLVNFRIISFYEDILALLRIQRNRKRFFEEFNRWKKKDAHYLND